MARRDSLKSVMRLIESAKKELPVEEDFLHDLTRSIEITAAKSSRKPSQSYKPSSMNCIRNMWYQIIGADQDEGTISYSSVGITQSGSDVHEHIQTAVSEMKSNGIDCEYVDVAEYVKSRGLTYLDIVAKQGMETKLYHKELNMRFLCDGIIKYKGRFYILELKTETSGKWYSRQGVDPKHYNQGTAYSIAFGLDNVIFVYINRDYLTMKSFMFHVTDEMKQTLIGKIEECDSYVKSMKVPPMPEDAGNKLCTYCAYRSRCDAES